MSHYKTIKTQAGLALEAAAETGGPAIKLVSMSIGDGGGQAYSPSSTQTALRHEVDRVNLNSLSQNKDDATQWVAEGVFPADRGGYTIRELGLWTEEGVLFAIANFPDTYKPAPSEGTAGQMLLGLTFRAQNSDNITLVVDGSLLMASRDWVNDTFVIGRATNGTDKSIRSLYLGNPNGSQPCVWGDDNTFYNLARLDQLNDETARAQNAESKLVSIDNGTLRSPNINYGPNNSWVIQPQSNGDFVGYTDQRQVVFALSKDRGQIGGNKIALVQDVQGETARAQAAESGLQPRGNYLTVAGDQTKTCSFITQAKHGQRVPFPTTFGDDNVIVQYTAVDSLNNKIHLCNYFEIDKAGFSPSLTVWNGQGFITEDNLVEIRVTATGKQ